MSAPELLTSHGELSIRDGSDQRYAEMYHIWNFIDRTDQLCPIYKVSVTFSDGDGCIVG